MYWAKIKGFKNLNDLSDHLGYSSPEKLYRLKRNPEAKPSFDIIQDFSNKFEDLNLNWFISNDPNPSIQTNLYKNDTIPSSEANEPHADFVKNKQVPLVLKGKNASRNASPTASPTTKSVVPSIITVDGSGNENVVLVNVKAAAGYLNGYGDPEYIQKLPSYSFPGLKHGTFRAFEVEGYSMEPTLENREIVICNWLEGFTDIKEDRVHVLVTKEQGIIIKRLLNRIDKYGYIIAKSDAFNNRNQYKNLHIYPEDVLEIWYPIMHMNANFRNPSEVYHRLNNFESDLEEIKRRLGI